MEHTPLFAALIARSRQLPRYTSYPTAPHFQALAPEEYTQWLQHIPPHEAVSLYLHVPYCKKLCWFCGCHTRITERYDPVEAYVALLQKEMEILAGTIGHKQPVSHIHWGGGSPTMLKTQDFIACMKTLNTHFSLASDAEIAIEIDPRNVSEAHIAAYAQAGMNRVSFGVQDFDETVQHAINRIQPFRLVYDKVYTCRDYGIAKVNLDLIYGLPKQTLAGLEKTVELSLLLDPDRISLFGYAHVPWKKKNIRLIADEDLPNETERLALFAMASDLLSKAGYIAVGLDHFAKPDDSMAIALQNRTLRRNFQGYTTDKAATLLGLGASAIGNLPQGYAQNTPSAEEYAQAINQGVLPVAKGFHTTQDDRVRRAVIESLMCYLEADVSSICEDHNLPPTYLDAAIATLEPLAGDGLIALHQRKITISPEIPQAVRLVCAAFDSYHTPASDRHAQVS